MNATDESGPPPPPPPPGPAGPEQVRRLTRSTEDKVLTGLCGGLGRYFGIDPMIFRVAFVVLALAGGTGILLYLVGWLLIPDDRGGAVTGPPIGQGRTRQFVMAVLVGLGILLLADGFDWFDGGDGPDFSLAVVLVAVGAAVLLSHRDRVGPPPPPPQQGPPPDSPPGPSSGPSGPSGPSGGGDPLAVPPPPSPPPSAPPPSPPSAGVAAPPRPRSVLIPLTLSALAVLGGTFALLGVPLAVSLALLLLATGAALVVGAWRGRARWLIPVALVLGMCMCAASVLDVPFEGGSGDRIYRPTTLAELRPVYRMAVGEVVLDLRALDLQGRTVEVLVTDGIGHLQVFVPRSASVVAIGHAGAGEVRLFDWSWAGTHVDKRRTVAGQEGGGRLVIEARVGAGQVEVLHAEA